MDDQAELTYLQILFDPSTERDEKVVSLLLQNDFCRLLMSLKDLPLEDALYESASLYELVQKKYGKQLYAGVMALFEGLTAQLLTDSDFGGFALNDYSKLRNNSRLAQAILTLIGCECLASSINIRKRENSSSE